jgi:hypothetical protein
MVGVFVCVPRVYSTSVEQSEGGNMEQEPVYVPANKLYRTCEAVLGVIYDRRQCDMEAYINQQVQAYNQAVDQYNGKVWNRLLGRRKQHITPFGMEEILSAEVARDENHPAVAIGRMYGELEHQTKDAMIQCKINDVVLVSPTFVRGVSHLGVPLDFMRRNPFGFNAQ